MSQNRESGPAMSSAREIARESFAETGAGNRLASECGSVYRQNRLAGPGLEPAELSLCGYGRGLTWTSTPGC